MTLETPIGNDEAPLTITQLRDRLLLLFQRQCERAITPEEAREIANVAGKVIKSAAVQSEWAQFRKDTSDIPFLK